MPVRAVTFDFWRTLFRDANSSQRQKVRIDALAGVAGVGSKAAAEALKAAWAEFDRYHCEEQRTLLPEDAVRIAAANLGVILRPRAMEELAAVFATAILQYPPEPIEGALDAVRGAAEHGPVGLVSDSGVSPGNSLRCLLDRYGFLGYFKVLVFSDEVGVAKPQPLMFRTAMAALDIEPLDLLHIGDREDTDVKGAKGIGGTAGLFLGDTQPSPDGTRADYVFRTWEEFVAVLPGIH